MDFGLNAVTLCRGFGCGNTEGDLRFRLNSPALRKDEWGAEGENHQACSSEEEREKGKRQNQHVPSLFSRAPGGSHREAAFLRDWLETAKKLLEAECFVFPPLLMGVFWVGDKHHDWGPLLQYLNTTVKTWWFRFAKLVFFFIAIIGTLSKHVS